MAEFDKDDKLGSLREILKYLLIKYTNSHGNDEAMKGLSELCEKINTEEDGWENFDIPIESEAGNETRFRKMVMEMYTDLVNLKRQADRGEKMEYDAGKKISFATEAVSQLLEENYELHEYAEASERLYQASVQMKEEEYVKMKASLDAVKKAKKQAGEKVYQQPHPRQEVLSEEGKISVNKRLISYTLEEYYEPYEYEETLERMYRLSQEIDLKKEKRKITGKFQLSDIKSKLLKITIAMIAIGLFSLGLGANKLYKMYFSKTSISPDSVVETVDIADLYDGVANEKEAAKLLEEIKELRKVGKFKKTLVKELTIDGVLWREYKVRYILSSGKEIIAKERENIDNKKIGKPNNF